MLIDTHCHLTFPEFREDLDEVVFRANESGIKRMIVPSINLETSKQAIGLADKYASVYAAVGVHPQESGQFWERDIDQFYQLSEHPKVVALGEVGLDYYRNYAPQAIQKQILETFLTLSLDVELPVIIHNRSAIDDLMAILNRPVFENVKGVFHCFSEDHFVAERVIQHGFMVSFTGTVTFKNSRSATVAQNVPLAKQLLETDAPFMAPVPKRGKRNEPAYLAFIAEKQAELHTIPVEEVAHITTGVAFDLFPGL